MFLRCSPKADETFESIILALSLVFNFHFQLFKRNCYQLNLCLLNKVLCFLFNCFVFVSDIFQPRRLTAMMNPCASIIDPNKNNIFVLFTHVSPFECNQFVSSQTLILHMFCAKVLTTQSDVLNVKRLQLHSDERRHHEMFGADGICCAIHDRPVDNSCHFSEIRE